MTNLMPIPLFLLKDNIILMQYKGLDSEENEIYNNILLQNVYIDFTKGKVVNNDGTFENDTLTMFFDNKNSLPSGQTFSEKDKLLIENAHNYGFSEPKREFSITSVASAPYNHHMEIRAV